MESFDEFIDRQYRMSEVPSFRAEIDEAYKYHEPDIVKMVDKEKGIYYAMEQDFGVSSDWNKGKIDFDADHLAYVKDVLSKPATRILDKSTGDISRKKLDEWITKIKRALQITQLNNFHNNFPKYIKSLELTLGKLEEIKIQLSLKKVKRGNPKFKKSISLSEEAKIIHYASNLLNEEPEKYKAKEGSYVSEQLKYKVTDDLEQEIPNITRHKVARLLLKHYAQSRA